ncbi:hypothetical protein [Pseudomonas sp.]|uniref:hypothetical protein n=1 Tax=Pseudomonas sp. TaxID=306 RepID=UPI002FCA4018
MNDLDLYSNGGQAVPVQPGGVDLYQGDAESHWGETPDYLSERSVQPLQDPQVQQNIAAIATVFENDMASLGFVQKDIDKCINWFKQSLANPVTRMPAKKHSYQLWQYSHDPAMNAFANYAHTQRFPQELIQSICYWIQSLEDYQHGVGRFAGVHKPASSDPTDSLSDSDYERVVQTNAQAAARTDGILRDKFGTSYHGAMKVIRDYWDKLSTAEQQHLEQMTTGWIKGTNTPEVLLGLYNQAIGAGSIPKDSVAIAREIASYENIMKTERSKWMKDDAMQARYRHLLMLRDGGR